LEVNPRASRTIPFVSKAIGEPLARYAARAMAGESLEQIGFVSERIPSFYSVKESVFPFNKFADVDTVLGPQMLSTGEVMGIDVSFELAFLKSQIAANNAPAESGAVFVSVRDEDKWSIIPIAKQLIELGFEVVSTRGTARLLQAHGVEARVVNKVKEGQPHIGDEVLNGQIAMMINTTSSRAAIEDSRAIRRATLERGVPYFTTLAAATAAVSALVAKRDGTMTLRPIQALHASS
jgi:carbamoyl-phosphate synthase large subunit